MKKITVKERVRLAQNYIDTITSGNTYNVFLGIGKNSEWSANDSLIEDVYETTDYMNQVHRDLVALKKLTKSNANLVVRRKDWANGTYYQHYISSEEMYSTEKVILANGTVTINSNSLSLTGINTTFKLDYSEGSIIEIPGDGISIPKQRKEVVSILSNNFITVNTSFLNYVEDNAVYKTINTSPNYYHNFYVRNIYDQVFVCLNNNNDSKSTIMPIINLGGMLPSDAYIETSDGYKWKYLYTIPPGLKQKYFTNDWMPIYYDASVLDSTSSGRLDIIEINNGGTGYNNSAAAFSAPILNVVGDGSGASITARVDANGTIYGINILNPGVDYTVANITANVGTSGANANITAIIGPSGGWGSNNAMQLGSTTCMVSVDLDDSENDTIPIVDALGNFFKYRQISLLADPVLYSGSKANATNYNMSVSVGISANVPFAMNDIVYQSVNGQLSNSSFKATIVYFNDNTNVLYLNNINGTFMPQTQLYATKNVNSSPYGTTVAFSETLPSVKPFTGDILYVENRLPVVRSPGQIENVKIIVEF